MFDKAMRDSRVMTDGTVFDSTASTLTRASLAVAAAGALLGLLFNSGAPQPLAAAPIVAATLTSVAG